MMFRMYALEIETETEIEKWQVKYWSVYLSFSNHITSFEME